MAHKPLPRPDITVTSAKDRDPSASDGSLDVVVSRDGKGKSFRVEGGSSTELVKDAVTKTLNEPYMGEFLP